MASGPLRLVDLPDPEPGDGEVVVDVRACGVCRTDLHLAEGDLAPHRPRTVPGHEVVGTVTRVGPGTERLVVGDRVGIAWLRHTCGRCRWCRRGLENLCPDARFTGWDADGGYAERAVVPEAFAYRIPEQWSDVHAAPLLCAGIIGYRALRLASLPDGGRLGIYGFGASAHLTAQVAMHQGATVHVMTRSPEARALALALGCASAGDTYRRTAGAVSMRRSSSPRPARSCRRRLPPSTTPGRWPIAGIHLSRHPAARLPEAPVPGARRCGRSPPTPGPTARSSCASPRPWSCRCTTRCTRSTRRTGPCRPRGGPRRRSRRPGPAEPAECPPG